MRKFLRQSVMFLVLCGTFTTMLCAIGDRAVQAAGEPKTPKVGDEAKDFTLTAIDGEKVKLSEQLKDGPVVLIVLRGFPGYQCPVCSAQVGHFISSAASFQAKKARILLVYPGPADGLKKHAADFVRGKTLPKNVSLVLDPDYEFTKSYMLRWDAANETAYPSTFVVAADGKIRFEKVSKTHSGRATVQEVMKAFETL
ncbi:MAG: peroxiredoxin family protein [Planctomycetia bacterium]|nr:peroxiredoxin family protein [Planctomycetia bacterium]